MTITAGKISASDLKGLLKQSYHSKKPQDFKDYEIDRSLSGQRVQVYKKKGTDEVFVVHRGSQGVHDWGNDALALAGYDISKSKRFKHAADIQKKAEAKYGAHNVSTLGHSLSGKIASEVGQDSKEIINLNKYVPPKDAFKKPSDKEYNIRTYRDPASVLTPSDPNLITIPSRSFNPLTEHKTDVLDRLPEDMMIGRGHLKKLSKKHLKDLIKRLPKTASKYKTTGKKKEELVEYCCQRCSLE